MSCSSWTSRRATWGTAVCLPSSRTCARCTTGAEPPHSFECRPGSWTVNSPSMHPERNALTPSVLGARPRSRGSRPRWVTRRLPLFRPCRTTRRCRKAKRLTLAVRPQRQTVFPSERPAAQRGHAERGRRDAPSLKKLGNSSPQHRLRRWVQQSHGAGHDTGVTRPGAGQIPSAARRPAGHRAHPESWRVRSGVRRYLAGVEGSG